MANHTDATVNISAEKVGKELLAYIKETQKTAFYQITTDQLDDVEVVDGDLDLQNCSAFGRWNYQRNVDGYFDPDETGQWLSTEEEKSAYEKLCSAIIRKKGSVTIDYTDTDPAMEWMGDGVATLQEEDGQLIYGSEFNEVEYSITNFAAMNGEDEEWALGYMYGSEVAEAYEKYVEEWKKDHSGPEFEGMEPAGASEWYDNEYQEEQE